MTVNVFNWQQKQSTKNLPIEKKLSQSLLTIALFLGLNNQKEKRTNTLERTEGNRR